MYVRRIEIRNIRCFDDQRHTVDLDLTRPDGSYAGWTVLAGRNGAGKTTFLKALALTVSGQRVADHLLGVGHGWIRDGASTGTGRVTLIRDATDGRMGTASPPFVLQIEWGRYMRGTDGHMQEHGVLPMPYRSDVKDGPWEPETRGWFLAGYGPFRRLAGHSREARRLMNTGGRVSRLLTLFREDASLQDSLSWLYDLYVRVLEEEKRGPNDASATRLRKSIFALLNDDLLPDGARIVDQSSKGLWIEQNGVKTLLDDLADGYKSVIGLILDIARHLHDCYGQLPLTRGEGDRLGIDLPGVVLVDEVETHLHPSWQQDIGFWLKERFPRIQFIVTTHSPFICQAADPKGLIRLPAPGEDRNAEHVSPDLYTRIVHGTADHAVMDDLFGLRHSRSARAQAKLQALVALEEKVIDGTATEDEVRRYREADAAFPSASAAVERALSRLGQDRASDSENPERDG